MRQLLRTRPVALFAVLAIMATTVAVVIPSLATRASAATITVLSVDFEDGTWDELERSGLTSDDDLSVVADDLDLENQALHVSGRANDWDGVSTKAGLLTAGEEYTVSVKVRLTDPEDTGRAMRLVSSTGFVWLGAGGTATADGWTTLTATFTAPQNDTRVYIGSDGPGTYDYMVDDFVVTWEEPAPPCEPEAVPVASYDFDEATSPWHGRGTASVSISDDARTGAGAMLVTGRTLDWHGAELPVSTILTAGTYTVTGWVKLPADAEGTDSLKTTVQWSDGTDQYTTVGEAFGVGSDEWVEVTGEFTVTGPTSVLYFEAASSGGDFLVDDVTIIDHDPCDGGEEEPEPCEAETATHTSIGFEDETLGTWLPNDSPTLGYTTDPEDGSNTVLAVSDRDSGWFGIQSQTGVFTEGVLYTISARVRTEGVAGTTHFTYNEPGAENPYAWVGTTSTGIDSEWITVQGTFTPGANAANAKIYIEVGDDLDYLIDDILITYLQPCGEGPVPGTVLLNADFEDETLQGWVPREGGNGPHSVTVTGDDSHGGDFAALVSERTSQGSGIGFDVEGLLEPGTQYEMTAWVKFAGSPVEDIVFTAQTGASSFQTLGTFTGVTNSSWTQVSTKFTFGSGDRAFVYFETPWEGADVTGNTTSFMIDDIQVRVPDAVTIEDLTPIFETVNFPVGVAIDQRETSGPSAELLLKHFNQITPENYMKPEAWYSGPFTWGPNSAEIDSLMNFAQANDLRLYGHVLVWHSQTPSWFFQKGPGDSTPLTTSAEDKQILRERLHDHIFNVAEYLSDGWGEFGGGDNPLVAFDVVNEVIDDSSAYEDGLRRSEWYRILGEEFIHLAFEYADEAFNDTYAADSADRPVALFINDYNTEQSGKRGRYLDLVERLLGDDVPVDGIGHQFHVSLSMPVENLSAALSDASAYGLWQAVTEFDVTTGTPESEAKFIDQGYYYRDAFAAFRAYEEQMFSVTVWGLIDSRSWRDSSGGPLVFDDDFQAKPAYYGIVEGFSDEPELPARLRTADVFGGDVVLDSGVVNSPQWERLPLHQIAGATAWQARWSEDHLTVFVTVDDSTVDDDDRVEFTVDGNDYYVYRTGGQNVDSRTAETSGGWAVVAQLPVPDAELGGTVDFDVSAVDDGDEVGWNTPGELGTLTLVEELSFTEIGEAQLIPQVDGRKDWIWLHADNVTATKNVQGSGGALGTFYHLWDDNTLYVYAEIADPDVDVSGSDPWIQDSVEIYVDAGNYKNGSYRYDDTQIRINADNVVSFGTGDETFQANRVQSATKRVPGGYIVEVAISLLEEGGLDTFHGVDFQVNDASNGARTAIRNWADPTGAGYQSTARWGVAQLVESEALDIPSDFPLADEDLDDSTKRCVLVPETARPGEQIVVHLCPEYAGDTVDVYAYSDPQFIVSGAAVGASITVTLPNTLTAGLHKIAVYDEDGFLIGWTTITIVLADGSMADTGAHITGAAFLAVALVLAGAGALWTRRHLTPMLAR